MTVASPIIPLNEARPSPAWTRLRFEKELDLTRSENFSGQVMCCWYNKLMEKEPITRELTEFELELSNKWQVFPDAVRFWVDELGMPTNDLEETARWALKDDHLDLIMEAKREHFEATLFPERVRD